MAEQTQSDHRQQRRQRAFLGAKIVYGEQDFTLDCVVRDLTGTGARLKLPDGQAVPDRFILLEFRSGVAYEAHVVWKRHPEIGVSFLSQQPVSDAATPTMALLKRLWIEHRERAGV